MDWPQLLTDILQDAAIAFVGFAVLRQSRDIDRLYAITTLHGKNLTALTDVLHQIGEYLTAILNRHEDGDFHLDTTPLPPENHNRTHGKENTK